MKNIISICSTTALVSLLCSIGFPKSVNAATFTYNLGHETSGTTGNPRRINAPSFQYETGINIDDPILTVTAKEAGVTRNIQQRSNGLGIIGQQGGNGQIDGRGGTFEELLLNFDRSVSIVSASFRLANGNDGFELLVGGNSLVTLEAGLNNNNPFDFSSFSLGDRTASDFIFSVSQSNDDYRLESVTISTTTVPESTSIFGLLAVGFIGLSSYRKVKNV